MKIALRSFAVLMALAAPALAQDPAPQGTPTVEQNLEVPPIAPGYRAPQTNLPELRRVGVKVDRQQPLTLRDALSLALENNNDIEVAKQNVRIAEFDLIGARGAYDPKLNTGIYFERINTPVASFLSGASDGTITTGDFTSSLSLDGQSPKYGGRYQFEFNSLRQTTSNRFTALVPQYPTSFTFTYTQPLWRGLKVDNNRRLIEIAKKNLSLTDAQFRQRAIETITKVQRSYWDLVFSLRNLQIQRDSVRDARNQLEHNKRLVNEGALAPIDVVAAEAQVAGFEQGLYAALEEVARAENALKSLIAEDRRAEIWARALIPTDSVELAPPAVSLPEAMEIALDNRPELQQSKVAGEINQIDQKYFRDQTKPGVDLVGSYGAIGLAGNINPNAINPFNPTPPNLPAELIGGYGQSLSNLFGNRYNNFRVGVQISLPLRNRTAEGRLGRALVEGERITTEREQLEQLIQVEVRNALQSIQSARARLRSAAIAREASEQQYESEKRKLDAGQSTVFLVLERQTALTTARGAELRAQTELNKASAELYRALGNSLSVNSVVVR